MATARQMSASGVPEIPKGGWVPIASNMDLMQYIGIPAHPGGPPRLLDYQAGY